MKTNQKSRYIKILAPVIACALAANTALAFDSFQHSAKALEHSGKAVGEVVMAGVETIESVVTIGAKTVAVPLYLVGAIVEESAEKVRETGQEIWDAASTNGNSRPAYDARFNLNRVQQRIQTNS